MLRYLLLFIICLSLHNIGKAQGPYESIFGQDSTQWVFGWGNQFGSTQSTVYVKKDTFYKGHQWKLLACDDCYSQYVPTLIREDTMLGKVWTVQPAIPNNPTFVDTLEKLAFDFSLEKGDSFDITGATPGLGTQTGFIKVDTTYLLNGRKHITFSHFAAFDYFWFEEGIGGFSGVLYKHEDTGMAGQHLFCAYKDGVQTYSNNYYNGNCQPYVLAVKKLDKRPIQVYPNPFNSSLSIEYFDTQKQQVIISNILGRQVAHYTLTDKSTYNLAHLSQGTYLLQILDRQERIIYQQLIIKQ